MVVPSTRRELAMTNVHPDTIRTTRITAPRTPRRLVIGVAALVLTDLVGGVLAVASGVNTWGEAWGSKALLAAPAPMADGSLLRK